jgi:phosphohistidine swiveling domain-containing protein
LKSIFDPRHDAAQRGEIGGKGYNLYQLQKTCTVPHWIALPTSAFLSSLDTNNTDTAIQSALADLNADNAADIAERIQACIRSNPLPDALYEAIATAVEACFGMDYVSVRSSAADEDGSQHSFAGIHESFLYVKGAASIADHIRNVWASGYQERALLYRKENGLPLHPVPMAVIIQRMINAETSGVVFTANPTTQNPHSMVISALYGLGEGLVSAGLDADHIEYNKRSNTSCTRPASKPTRYMLNLESGAGIHECAVDDALQEAAALSPEQIENVATTARAIEMLQRRPQDIEFCFDAAGALYILQTRDITTVDGYGPAAGNPQIWDNSNIIESYSGVTSPMTFSFIRHAYAVVYNCFSEVMGIPRKTITKNQNVYRNMLGLFQGQVYYNLPNWYRLVQQFPGYDYNKSFMESMMGVKDKADTSDGERPPANAFRRYCVELPKLIGLAGRMLYRFMSLHRLVPAFNRHFDHYYNTWATLDFDTMPPHELMHIYDAMETHLLRNWKTPIINDFYVMVFYGTLKGCCKKWCDDDNGTLQNNLICGEGDIESTVPTRLLMKLASEIKANPQHRDLFLAHTPEALLERIPNQEDTQYIADAITRYLDAYGFRCMNELKLEEPSLHETPEFVYQMIANYVRMDDELLDLDAMSARENTIRVEAESTVFEKLSRLQSPLFKFVLKHARRGVKNRENMRFARTKIYGLLRQLLNSIGATYAKEQILDQADDIYYLALDEVFDFIKGTAISTDLKALTALRKVEFDGYRAADTPPDDHFETYGMAYHRNDFVNPDKEDAPDTGDGSLRGIGCSPGTVEGKARVIHSPRDDVRLNGEILVAARTDPGWVPLYPSVSGILIERGSILSHSAIVAREMGIPAIVGIPNLLQAITDGQTIHMDASSGHVTIR